MGSLSPGVLQAVLAGLLTAFFPIPSADAPLASLSTH